MSCVLSAARSAARPSIVSAFSGLSILGLIALPAHANELDPSPAQPWCVARSGEQPDCTYGDLLTCSVKALALAGYCVQAERTAQAAATAEPAPTPMRRKPPRRKLATANKDQTAVNKDKLFEEFVRWKQAGGK